MVMGMTKAVINAALKLPKNKKRTTMTNSAPSARFLLTVLIVAFTKFVRL